MAPKYTVAAALFVASCLVSHWSAPSLAFHHWDSLEYAHAVETGGAPLAWGNHPLGHVVFSAFYRGAGTLGYSGRALPFLQQVNAGLTAAAVALLFLTLRTRWRLGLWPAAGWAGVFGSAYAVIHYAGTADIYAPAMFAFVGAWHALLGAAEHPTRGRWMAAGVLAGIAGLTHQFAVVLLGVGAVVLLWRQTRGAALALGFATLTTLAIGYGVMGYLAIGSLSPAALLAWIRGYAGDPTYGRFLSLDALGIAFYSSTQSLVRGELRSDLELWRWLLLGVVGLVLVAGPWLHRHRTPELRLLQRATLAQCVVGLLLILWWEPGLQGKFWLVLAPLVTAVFATGLPSRGWLAAVPGVLAVTVLTFNQIAGLQTERRPDIAFEDSLQRWIDHSSRDDVLLESSRFTAHLLFWGDRPGTANVYRLIQASDDPADPYARVRRVIEEAWARDARVLFAEGLDGYYSDDRLAVVGTSRAEYAAFFEGFAREGPVFMYREGTGRPEKQAYRLVPPVRESRRQAR